MSKKFLTGMTLDALMMASAIADETKMQRPVATAVSSADVMQWMISLLCVLSVIAILIWGLRKTGNLTFTTKNELSVISGISLGMREKLVLVKVGEKQLLLAVTPNRVEKLLELEGDARLFERQTQNNGEGVFAKKLQQIMQGKSDV